MSDSTTVVRWVSPKTKTYSRRHLLQEGEARTNCGTMVTKKGKVETGGEVDCLTCTELSPIQQQRRDLDHG